jgi:hypothetical protein
MMEPARHQSPYPLPELPEFAVPTPADDRPPPEPVPIPLGWRIVGWIWSIISGLAGG